MFEVLTFKERLTLAGKLLSSSRQTIYERDQLAADPRAVAYQGQAERMYAELTDDTQALVDEIHAVDQARLA